jgi:hypothetical protein
MKMECFGNTLLFERNYGMVRMTKSEKLFHLGGTYEEDTSPFFGVFIADVEIIEMILIDKNTS